MQNNLKKVLFGFCLLFLPACTQTVFDEPAIREQVLAELRKSEQAWNEGSIEDFLASYDNSDSLRFASGGEVHYGWQPVLDRYKRRYQDKAAMGHLTFSALDVTVLTNDAAIVFGRFTLHRDHDQPTGLFTLLFRKTADGWRIVHDHTSSSGE